MRQTGRCRRGAAVDGGGVQFEFFYHALGCTWIKLDKVTLNADNTKKNKLFLVLSAFSVIVPCIHFHSISEVKQRWVRLVFGWVVAEKYKK